MSALPPLPPLPPPRLETILQAIGEQIARWRGEVTYRVGGAEQVAKTDLPPRVVMVPVSSTIGPIKTGGKSFLWNRAELVKIHIHGASIAEVEGLVDLVFNAINRAVTWPVGTGVGTWLDRGALTNGWALLHEATFNIPIVRIEAHATLVLADQPTLEFAQLGT